MGQFILSLRCLWEVFSVARNLKLQRKSMRRRRGTQKCACWLSTGHVAVCKGLQ